MQMNEVIQTRRRALGLTQEQVADALGVTAPAVNKWEKGSTCPDIALLAPLARLLGIDLNELLCFHENLTDQEVHRYSLEVMQTAQRDGLEAGFELARERLRCYPNSEMLMYTLAVLLQGFLSLSANDEARAEYENQLTQWYERAAESEDPQIRDRVSLILASNAIRRKDWDAAQRAIDALPDRPPTDKRTIQARLRFSQDQPEEAAKLLQHVLFAAASELTTVFLGLVDAEIATGDLEAADAVAKAHEAVMQALDQLAYVVHAAPLQVAVARKDVRESVRRIRLYLDSLGRPWEPYKSPLYRRISTQEQTAKFNERVYAAVLKDLSTNSFYDFLRADAEFQELLAECQSHIEQE